MSHSCCSSLPPSLPLSLSLSLPLSPAPQLSTCPCTRTCAPCYAPCAAITRNCVTCRARNSRPRHLPLTHSQPPPHTLSVSLSYPSFQIPHPLTLTPPLIQFEGFSIHEGPLYPLLLLACALSRRRGFCSFALSFSPSPASLPLSRATCLRMALRITAASSSHLRSSTRHAWSGLHAGTCGPAHALGPGG